MPLSKPNQRLTAIAIATVVLIVALVALLINVASDDVTGDRRALAGDATGNARGVTDNEILIGATYDRKAGGANESLGIEGVGQIDGKRALQAVAAYINERGGIAGRRVKLVLHENNSQAGQTLDQIAQETCATWTQDSHVFAALAGDPDTLNDCLHKAGVVQIGISIEPVDSSTYRRFPNLIHMSSVAMDRLAPFYVDQLHARGYYSRTRTGQPKTPIKVGVVSWDGPVFDRTVDVFRRALARHDLELAAVAKPHRYESEAEVAESIDGIRSAVLRFKSEGITHVQFLSTVDALEQLTFYQEADVQRYYPRYGLTSIDSSQALIPLLEDGGGKDAAKRTFTDSLAIGWNPLFDVAKADYSGEKELPELRKCKEIVSNERYDDPTRNKEVSVARICDGLFLLKAYIEKGGADVVNQATFRNGAASVGGLPSAFTFENRVSAQHHDGVGVVRDIEYFEDCNCFHYTSEPRKV